MGASDNGLSCCGRITLGILNTIFLIIGFVLLILGILVFAYTPGLQILLGFAISTFEGSISGESGAVFNVEYLVTLVQTFAYILIGLGAFFFIIALLGIIGGCCKVKCVLFVYIILMVILIVTQIAIMIIIFSERQVIDSSIKTPLEEMASKYTGTTGKDKDSVTLNFLMITLGCCGVTNSRDFVKISAGGTWQSVYSGTGTGTPMELDAPAVCCVNPKVNLPNGCATTEVDNPMLSNANKGCYDELWKVVDAESDLVIGICSAIIILQAILLFFAVYIVYKMSKEEEQ